MCAHPTIVEARDFSLAVVVPHQSSGDVVDLPDFLLPEGQYLDMFNSESDLSGDLSNDELVEVP